MNLSVTLNFNSVPEMLGFFSRAAGVIAPEDRPDAGAPLPPLPVLDPPAPQPSAAQVFGIAPSVAAAAPSATVPAVPPVTSVAPTLSAPAALIVSVAPAPTAPVAPSGSVPAADRDVNGLPWDGRIHASTKTKNADGTWRGKRGVDDAEVARVTSELRGVAPPVPPAVISPAAAALPALALAAAPRAITFGELMVKLQGPMISGQLPKDKLQEVLTRYGCPAGIPQLVHRDDLVPAVDAELCAMLGLAAGAPA